MTVARLEEHGKDEDISRGMASAIYAGRCPCPSGHHEVASRVPTAVPAHRQPCPKLRNEIPLVCKAIKVVHNLFLLEGIIGLRTGSSTITSWSEPSAVGKAGRAFATTVDNDDVNGSRLVLAMSDARFNTLLYMVYFMPNLFLCSELHLAASLQTWLLE